MRSHLRSVAKRKVSDFLLREEGMVGNRSAFATAALVSTTALAMTLLVAPEASAGNCDHCEDAWCCFKPGTYVCPAANPGPPYVCIWINNEP